MTDRFTADCASCFGLCCTALAFTRSADFAVDKPAGAPCTNLTEDYRCGIHSRLCESGFRGCTVFDCSGAGQKVSQHTFGGVSWREDPGVREAMFAVFPVVRGLQELLRHLDEAAGVPAAAPLRGELGEAFSALEQLTESSAEVLLGVDVDARRREVGVLLGRVSELVRAGVRREPLPAALRRRVRPGADLLGAALRGADLRGTELRGALLIAADLQGADLRVCDLLGADLRDADLRGADLTGVLFLTQVQLDAARGDDATRLPPALVRPAHWSGARG